jgi:hypothetical protein
MSCAGDSCAKPEEETRASHLPLTGGVLPLVSSTCPAKTERPPVPGAVAVRCGVAHPIHLRQRAPVFIAITARLRAVVWFETG